MMVGGNMVNNVTLTYLQKVYCHDETCKIDGVEFSNYLDVSRQLGVAEIEGNVTLINHSLDSAIELSIKLFETVEKLNKTIEELNNTIVELTKKEYQLLTGEEI